MMARPVIAGRYEETRVTDEEEGGSIFGGLGEAAGAAWDAGENVAGAAVDGYEAYAGAVVGGIAHVDAGVARAVGADGLADEIQDGANVIQDEASANLSEAGSELSQAGEDVWGG
jgi:hypothetical protein